MKLSLNVKEPGIHDEVSEMATKEVNTSLGTNFNNSWNVDDKEWLKKHEEVSEEINVKLEKWLYGGEYFDVDFDLDKGTATIREQ